MKELKIEELNLVSGAVLPAVVVAGLNALRTTAPSVITAIGGYLGSQYGQGQVPSVPGMVGAGVTGVIPAAKPIQAAIGAFTGAVVERVLSSINASGTNYQSSSS